MQNVMPIDKDKEVARVSFFSLYRREIKFSQMFHLKWLRDLYFIIFRIITSTKNDDKVKKTRLLAQNYLSDL